VKISTTTPQADAAEALVLHLPSSGLLVATARQGVGAVVAGAPAVAASFVGATAADVAVILNDAAELANAAGTDSSILSVIDLLRPALEAATAVLGVGVLGDAHLEEAASLSSDADAAVFELTSDGAPAGWFAIRLRDSGTVGQLTQISDRVVAGKLGRINSVEMALTVEIGRTRMSVRDVLSLEPGAVIELDRSAGAPADVLLNGRLIAHGEIVVVDQDYAVRITQILDVAEGLS
jgi:flagellar motor switch protein FliN/FliY